MYNTKVIEFSKKKIFSSKKQMLGISKIEISHNLEEIVAVSYFFGTRNKIITINPDCNEIANRRVAALDERRLRFLSDFDAEISLSRGKLFVNGHHKYDKPCTDPLLPDLEDYVFVEITINLISDYAIFVAKKKDQFFKISFGRGSIRGPGQNESIDCKTKYPDFFKEDLWEFEATINTSDLLTVVNFFEQKEGSLYLCLPVDKNEKDIIFLQNYEIISIRCVDYLNNVKW